jgi:hypothetical protein
MQQIIRIHCSSHKMSLILTSAGDLVLANILHTMCHARTFRGRVQSSPWRMPLFAIACEPVTNCWVYRTKDNAQAQQQELSIATDHNQSKHVWH